MKDIENYQSGTGKFRLFKQWSLFERIWFISFLVIIITTTVYFSFTGTDYSKIESILLNWVISPISAISGIICVILAAKGKISTWTYGIVNSILYGYLAYRTGYYGDAIINIVYFLPTQFIGLLFWKTRLKNKSKVDVKMRKLTVKQAVCIFILGLFISIGFGVWLHSVDNWFTEVMKRNVSIYSYFEQVFGSKAIFIGPILDSSTEVTQILAQLFMVLAYAEQWVFWIITNIITIIMWAVVIVADPSSISWALPTLFMWIAYLINSIYGWIIWKRGVGHDE
ncbi:nicotinamide mononucleotide transporter [Mobilisporobacter senegalensis]|uniref:Nicotinamide mononucleotide transporter n=1 Tax=Mobilisporobacter senegalensis TaxID=1329262 RepID=A0A3N1XGH4_9FIRM|nr:nicotinamide riboside transporter PnuC [Mobilisporobacter senegalensis]ROR25816.1 nicotinamide mononucleotide transporter [Mobilisporobacter senegalensis]